MCPKRIYKMNCFALLNVGAVPSLIPVRLLFYMGIDSTAPCITVAVANDVNAGFKEAVEEITLTFVDQVAKFDFLAVDGVPVELLIGLTDLERLQATLDVGG